MLDEAAQKLPGVKVRIGRLSDFADAIVAEKADLPVVRGDAPDTWIHGPMSDPAGAGSPATSGPLIAATESLNTQLRRLGRDGARRRTGGRRGLRAEPALRRAHLGRDGLVGRVRPDRRQDELRRGVPQGPREPAASRSSKPPGTSTPPTSRKRRRFSRRSCRRTSSRWPGAWTRPDRGSSSTIRCPGSATAS